MDLGDLAMSEVNEEQHNSAGPAVTLNLSSLIQSLVGVLLAAAVVQLFMMNATLNRIEVNLSDMEKRLEIVENRVGVGMNNPGVKP